MNRRDDQYDRPMDDGRGYPDGSYGGYPDGSYRGEPAGYGHEPVRRKGGAGMGIAALLLGILALVLFWIPIVGIILGVIALIMGLVARGRAKRINGTGRGMGVAGAILGLIAAVLCGLVSFGIFTLFQNTNYDECLREAGTDQSAIEQCMQDFADEVGGQDGGGTN